MISVGVNTDPVVRHSQGSMTETPQSTELVETPRNQKPSSNFPKLESTPVKQEEFWRPPRKGAKRQRLPTLDWRKGERYIFAPDGTVIGKEGFETDMTL